MSLGIALMIKANLGGAPWDVLHIGLTNQLGLTVGTWSILMGVLILSATSLLMKAWPQLGAFLNMLLVGLFIDLFLWLLPTSNHLFIQLAMLVVGVLTIGYGIGLYIAPGCGAGPRDSLMLALQIKTGLKVQYVRGIMEIMVLTVGWLLGGPVFIGTILFCFGIGSVVGFTLPQCQRLFNFILEKRNEHEDLNKGTLRLDDYDRLSEKAR